MTRIEASRGTCVWRNGAHSYFKEGLAAGWIALTLLVVLSGDHMVARAQRPGRELTCGQAGDHAARHCPQDRQPGR